jgi:hypothetical protein
MAEQQPALEIDYSQVPTAAPSKESEEWEPPVHKYFGPKDLKTGKRLPEPVYVHQEYPRTVYGRQGHKIVARLVRSDAELKALGAGWEKNPSAFGFIGAPSLEEHYRIQAALAVQAPQEPQQSQQPEQQQDAI